jgi:TrmH family RNA methyltransferase
MKKITSRENALYKSIRRLARSSSARSDEGRIVLDGVHLVRAYLERFGARGVELVVRESSAHDPEIGSLAKEATSVVLIDTLFDQAASVQSPVGILALAPLPHLAAASAGHGFQVLLDGVQDPGNVGAILRSAAAAGAKMAHLSVDCADPWSPKCLRGGMGAQFVLPVQQHLSLADAAQTVGARLVACAASADTSLFDADLSGRIAFIIGGEGSGISHQLLAQADQQVRVPMNRGIESLNAAASATVCFYEWLKQNNRKIPLF